MWIACLILVFAPGAWITCGFTLTGLPLWARLFTGATLSPLVVCAEFYVVRLLGLPFDAAALALVFLNLPALWLAWKRREKALPRAVWAAAAATVLIPSACMVEYFLYDDARMFSPHAFLYSDPVYMLERGDLVLEDPTFAGVRLGYPVWSALVSEAVTSGLLKSAPFLNYVWSNLLWLILVFGLAAGTAKELGGGRLAQISAGIFLLVGSNPVGYFLALWTPAQWRHLRLWGDPRYTPWVSKFYLYSTMPIGLGMLMALIYLLVRRGPLTRQMLVLICLLTSGIGLLYPLLLPPAFGVIAAKALAVAVERRPVNWRVVAGLAGVIVVAAVAAWAEVHLLSGQRHSATPAVELSTLGGGIRKILAGFVATSVFLAGIALVLRRCWTEDRAATLTLAGGALASFGLHAAFAIPYWDNEYKFIFAAAMFLAAFPALAVERIWRECPRAWAVPVLAAVLVLMSAAYTHLTVTEWRRARQWDASVLDARRFDLDLDSRQPLAGICKAVRSQTPRDAILVTASNPVYFPEVTSRSLYVPAENQVYPGVNLWADDLLAGVRGYGYGMLNERRGQVKALYSDPEARTRALERMLELKRPLAVILDPAHAVLASWFESRQLGHAVYRDPGYTLWLIPAGAHPAQPTLTSSRNGA